MNKSLLWQLIFLHYAIFFVNLTGLFNIGQPGIEPVIGGALWGIGALSIEGLFIGGTAIISGAVGLISKEGAMRGAIIGTIISFTFLSWNDLRLLIPAIFKVIDDGNLFTTFGTFIVWVVVPVILFTLVFFYITGLDTTPKEEGR